MKPALLALAAAALLAGPALATDVSGPQSGTWTLAYSPYELVGDVYVPAGESLTIAPGVLVRAKGYYKITVSQARLHAVGTTAQPIVMTAADTLAGWRGLRLEQADNASRISHCVIEYAKGTGPYPDVRGGAIFIKQCAPTISHNELRFNSSHNSNYNGCGGGVLTEDSAALILENYIHDNYADSGGGVCCTEYGTPLVAGNRIIANTSPYAGGGIYLGARSSARVEGNLILRNTASGWGGGGINSWTSYIFYGTFPTIRNNLIAQNKATTGSEASGGGGVYCRYDRAILTGNTIAGNQSVKGGGLYILNYPDQAPQATNDIAWGNTASSAGAQIYLYPDTGSAIVVSYCDVQGGWGGVGNIDLDPLFADPAADDYHLTGASPCIDRGDPAFVPQPGETDVDGQWRVWAGPGGGEGRVDMGADEYGSHTWGDANCDGAIDAFDIDPFVLALTDPAGYAAAYPACELLLADVNRDGKVDAFDIDPFVALLTGG